MHPQPTEPLHPHQGQPRLTAGAPLAEARAALVLLHGRGASAHDIMLLSNEFADIEGFAYLAPQAYRNTWYPNRFLAPTASNEPWLSSALAIIDDIVASLADHNIPPERTILLGFSQGACLSLEYAARNARRYGGVAGLSGGLIGADGEPRHDNGTFEGTPIFLGCSDVDMHIPAYRVQHAANTLTAMGADITMRLYPQMDHTVNQDEIEIVQKMMQALLG